MVSTAASWRVLACLLADASGEAGITNQELAERACVDVATVRRLLAGRPVRLSSARLLVEAVGLDWRECLLAAADAEADLASIH
jgi:hypothetical protein